MIHNADVYIALYNVYTTAEDAPSMSSAGVLNSALSPSVADTVATPFVDRLAIAALVDDRIDSNVDKDASSSKSKEKEEGEKKLHKPQTT